jgi:hypothetical protein
VTKEEKLREFILSQYRSVLEFTQSIEMPYGTMQSIFKRGIDNSSITNIIKICHALGISADELAKGKIIPVKDRYVSHFSTKEIDDVLTYCRMNIDSYTERTIGGMPMTVEDAEMLLDGMEVTINLIKRKKKRMEYV